MTRSAPGSFGARRRRRVAALAVVAIGTVIVAAVSFALSRADRPTTVPPASPTSTGPASPVPGVVEPPTSRSYLDAGLGAGIDDPLGPTTDHPVWFADDRWWAALLDPPTGQTRLNRLAPDGAAWVDTGRVLDERTGAIVDAVWADGHLYVASVVRDRAVGSGVRLTRYSDDPASGERPDPDFPVLITERGVRAVALARDGAGRLWLAIIRDGALQIAHSVANDASWTAPIDVEAGGPVDDDDVVGLVVFGSGRVGLVWTSRVANTVRFAWRSDGDAVDAWSAPETVASGSPLLRDPISAAAGPDGSVLVTVAGDVRGSSSSPGAARLVLARRDASGTWNATVVGRVEDRHGPAGILADAESGRVSVIATDQSDGSSWVLKQSAPGRLVFETGEGTALGAPEGIDNPDIGGPHITASPGSSAAEAVVLGFDATLHRYVHMVLGPPAGAPPSSPGPSSSAGAGSPAPSDEPVGGPVKGLPVALINDTFDPFEAGVTAPNGWTPRTGDPADRIAVAVAAGRGRVLGLRSTARDGVRACKPFTLADSGTLTATVVVRLDALATSDATITSLRLHSSEAALVRFGSGGTFAYYSGGTKVRTSVPWKTGTWYRSTVRIDLERHTYDWQLAVDGKAAPLIRVRAIPFRDPTATAVDSICVQTSSGRADLGLAVDRVVVTR